MSDDESINNQPIDDVDAVSPIITNKMEDEILGTPDTPGSPDRAGVVMGWMKSALSPLLSASAMTMDELHDPFFDDTPIMYNNSPTITPAAIRCSYGGCKRMVGPGSSQFGCPSCGKTYCSTHSGHPSFEVHLASPKTGYVRVCLACWTGRPENQTGLGTDRSWLNAFSHHREAARLTEAQQRSLLESRLTQLMRIEEEDVNDKKAIQQKVVQWVPDDSSHVCPICEADFGLARRRHHCRLCGSLMCADCTTTISSFNIPACTRCYSMLNHTGPILVSPVDPLLSNYQNLTVSRTQILEGLPRFNEYLVELESELACKERNRTRIEAIQHDANAIRETLMLIFEHYEGSARLIGQLMQSEMVSQRDLVVRNILVTCQRFIKEHRFSLKALPGKLTMFDDQPSESIDIPSPTQDSAHEQSFSHKFLPGFLQGRSRLPTVPEPQLQLPANLGALMQKLEVLHEQKAQLEVFLEDARVNRRFGELATLQRTIEETDAEITSIKLMCSR